MRATNQRQSSPTTNNAPLHRWVSTNRLKTALVVLLAVVALAVPVWLASAASRNVWRKPRITAPPPSISHSNTKRNLSAAPIAGTIYVNDDWVGTPANADPDGAGPATNFGVASFATIQDGVNGAAPGDTVFVYAGNYTEQVTISKNLTLTGENTATTVLHTPATLSARVGSPSTLALVQVDTSAVVDMSGLTISGPYATANGCADPPYYGIFVIGGANLNLHDAAVTDIQLSPASLHGCQTGVAVRAGSQFFSEIGTLTVNNAAISGYQKGAIVVDNTGSSGTITNNTITGLGLENIAANAIQISRGAGATITGNNVTANECTSPACGTDPLNDTSTGVLVYQTSSTLQISNNTISNNDVGIYNNGDNTTISGNTLVANRYNGIFQDKGSATITGNTLTGPMNVGVTAVSFNGNTGNSTATLTGNTITGATTGLQLVDETNADVFVPQLTAHFNRIVSGTAAIDNPSNQIIDLKNNWWGCNAGPGFAGCGTVTGTGADFTPWFVVAAQAAPTSMTPGGTSNVTVDMTHTSDSAPSATPIPNTPVSYDASPNGTMTPASGTITAGAASSQFTSTTSNSATINVTVDNQNIPLPITVTAPSFSIDDVTHNEGNPPGTTAYVFTVTKTGATALNSSVQFQTADGSATLADNDYVSQGGTLTFLPADTTKQITVLVNADATLEPNETFAVNLSAPSGATISDASGTGTITNDDPPPSIVYVDDNWVGTTPGTDPDSGGPATNFGYDSFATIQEGVNAVAVGGTVIVADGTYIENPSVNRAVTIKGANFGVAGSAVRSPESIVRTNGNQLAVFLVTAANVTIDGFTIDGDDPGLSGIALPSGDNTNSSYGVRPNAAAVNHLNVSHNIIKKVEIGLRGDVASQGNVINQNWFDNIGHFDFGYCVSIRNNFYADVTNNKMTRAWSGVHINNHNTATGPASFNITGNEIHSYAGGILYWLQFNGATGATINNNQMTAEAGAVANNFGVLMVSIQNAVNPTFTNNTITGHNYGIGLFNVPTTSTITLGATNSVSNSSLAGVFLTDNLNFDPITLTNFLAGGPGAVSTVNVSGLSISGNTGDGVKVEGATNAQTLNVSGSTITGTTGTKGVELVSAHSFINLTASTVTGFSTGVSLQNSSGATAHFNRIISSTTAIDNPNNQTPNLENNWWGCNAGPGNTGCGTVTGTGADFNPWIVLGGSAAPNSIAPGDTSTVTADMTHNSDTLVPAGTLPDIPDSFSATNGTMNPTSHAVVAGTDSSLFTSTNNSSAVATITVDNQPVNVPVTVVLPSFSINDVTHNEGNGGPGTTSYTFTITKTGGGAASVDYATVDSSAKAPSDYTAIPTTTLSFLTGDASKQVTVLVNGDTTFEVNEAFTVHLSNAVNATISDADGLGTINNDDSCAAFSTVYVDASWAGTAIGDDPDGGGPATVFGCDSFATIQEGINAVTAGGTVNVAAGTYTENVTIPKGLTLTGAGAASVFLRPAVSNPNCGGAGGGSLCAGASNLILVQANNVTISGLTLDGDNPSLTSSENFGGANIDARNGIITNHVSGVFNNLEVHHTTVKNIYLRGIYASSGGTFNFHDNTVQNVQADPASISMFNFAGSGAFTNNNVSGSNDAISSNHSTGTTYTGNTITNSASGIHSDNAGDGGGTPDTISGNTVTNSSAFGFGIWVFVPYKTVTVQNNTVTNVDVGLAVFGDSGVTTTTATTMARTMSVPEVSNPKTGKKAPKSANTAEPNALIQSGLAAGNKAAGKGFSAPSLSAPAVAPFSASFIGNTVNGQNKANSIGAYFSTSQIGFGSGSPKVSATSNTVINNTDGFYLEAEDGFTLETAISFNRIVFNTNSGATQATGAGLGGTMNGSMENNWWGCNAGPNNTGCGSVVGAGIDFNPWIVLGVSASPASIPPFGTSTVTADMTHDSNGGTPAGVTTLPLPNAAFTATNGNMSPTSNGFTAGQSQSTFTSTSSSSGQGCAAVDNQPPVCTPITVAVPSFSIDNVTLAEGNAGTTSFTFTITKTGAGAASVDYATVNGTATAPSDYTAIPTTTLNFLTGDTFKQVTVLVNGDTAVEANETFNVHLSNAINATISNVDGLGTINNDDACATFSTVYVDDSWAGTAIGDDPDGAGPATVFGCDSFATIQGGVTAVTLGGTVIVRDGTYTENVSITKAMTLKGAQFGVDARGRAAAESIVSPAASTAPSFDVAFNGLITIDGFTFSGGPTGASGAIFTSVGPNNNMQISNNRFINYPAAAIWMNRGGSDITIDKNVLDGGNISGSGQAIFGNGPQSYNGLFITNNNIINNTGRYGFFVDGNHNVGESATRAALISGNLFDKNLQGLNLGSRSLGTLGTPVLGTYAGTISNNTFSNNTANGIQAGIQHVLVSGNTFTNNAIDGLALTSFGNTGADRGAQNSIIVSNTFTGNVRSGLFFSGTQGVGLIETNHANFNRFVGNAVGVQYGSTVAGGNNATIDVKNNWWGCNFGPGAGGAGCTGTTNGTLVFAGNTGVLDSNPWIVLGASASPASIPPGGTSTVTADMTQNSNSVAPSITDFVPQVGVSFSATNGNMAPPTATITSGQAQSTFTSTNFSNGQACGTVDSQQTCTSIPLVFPSFSIDNVTLAEGNAGTTSFTFTITKTGAGAASVDYATLNGTATAPSDYTAIPTTTLSFLSGDVSKQVTVLVNGDTAVEADETFTVRLSNAIHATISNADGLGTINNDDSCATFSTVYVNKSWAGTAIGDDPDGAGPATVFGCDSFATIQEGVNVVTAGGTVIVAAGNYPENVTVPRSLSLLGPNASVDPNTGTRSAEAIVMPAVVETSSEGSTSGTVFRVGSNSGHVDVTIKGFTIDGHNPNPLLTGGRTLNGVVVQTGAGIVNSTGSFDTNPGAYDATMIVQNNVIQNLERYGVLVDNVPSRPAVTGSDVSHNKIDNLPSGNNFGGGRGRGIAFEENAYGSATFNVMTKVNVGWQDDNYNLASPGAATVVSHNTISTYHRGIFHNLQYQDASNANISDNSISVETNGDFPASTTNFGVELASIQSAVGVAVTNNNSTGNVYGILLWNLPTTANITVTGGTLTNNQYGVFATSNDPQFAAGAASHSLVSGVTVTNAAVAGIGVDDSSNIAATALEVSGNTSITSTAVGAVGILVKGANASANVHDNGASIHDLPVGITVDGGSATITANNLYNNVTGLRFLNGGTATAHFNRILSTTTAIDNPASSTSNLENNWWGCNAGPGHTGCGTVTGTGADFDPRIVLGVSASPGSIGPGDTSTVTADMTHDSNGGTPAGVTALPLPNASFTATNGTILPASNSFTLGQSQSTFTSTNSSSSSACGKVDNEEQCTPITVAFPSFSISDVTLAEGNVGTTSFTFTITKTGPGAASIDYATVDGSAKAPSDYTAISPTTLSFASGDASKTVTVLVNGDTTFEALETFTVHLSNPLNATIGDADGVGTITNDDTCSTPTTVYVDDSWLGTAIGDDPDGAGPATSFGCDSFATIQEGIDHVAAGGTVIINAGTYNEDVNANNAGVSLLGAGAGSVSVVGPIGGPGSTIVIGASNVTIAGMTITRAGNTVGSWNDPNLNSAGISIQGQSITNALIRDNILTGNRTGIDINNSNGHTVRNNSITDNRTGMILRNQTDNLTVVENFITNNWTVGVLFLDASGGTNSPVQTAHFSDFNNNDLSGNWYGQIVDRQSGGSLPAPGTTNLKNFRGDWFGTATPVTTTANSSEPGYAAQIPVEFGGSATPPGGQPDIAGPASANFKIDPILTVGTDTNVETTPGRGTNGFQGVAINQTVVVEPSNLQGWFDFDDDVGMGTGSGGFMDGPGTAPLGAGSYFLRVDPDGRHAVGTFAYIGTRMDDITELKYSSYQNNNTNTAAAIALQFDIDYDLNDSVNTYMGRLVFEPYISNTVQQGAWQNWDAMAGKWYGTKPTVTVNGVAGVTQPCQMATPCTWSQVLNLFPNAGVGNTPVRTLLFKAGGPVGPGGFDGNVDNFSIKVNTVRQTYDFEPNPHLSINDVSHNEGNTGTTNYDFTVTLSRASSQTVTVDYATANDSAVAPGDFTAIGTTQLTFNPGDTSKTITVAVNGDVTNESNEQFFVNLSNPSASADITDNQGVGTIVNDDAQPSFSIDDVTHNEGNSGTTNFTFTVTKTGATGLPTSVQFQTVDGSATIADNDYASQSGTLNFGPADTTMQVTVLVNGDTTVEPTEAFTVHLSAASGATISDADGTGTITNDDRAAPNVVYVDDNWVGTAPGTDPDGAGPATEFGYDAFATIQNGVNGVADNGTVNVYAGNYPENVTIPKSVSLLGPNASVDPNTASRSAEAIVMPAVVETSSEGSTSGTVFRVGSNSGHVDVTIKGFTIDGHNPNPLLTGGRTLNGVVVQTGAGIVNSTGSFDTNPGAYDATMIVQNNVIQNLERYGVLVDNVPSRPAVTGSDVSHNKIDNLPSGNNFGGGRGRGIAFEENAYGSATFNVMTRVNVGWQDDNYNLTSPGAGTLVDHNQIHTYHRGIFHNLQYQSATAAMITNNQLFAETTGDFPASTTNFGVELSSIQSAVGVTVTDNSSTGNVYGILIWNVPTTNTITVSGGTLTGNQYGVLATLTDPQFGAGSAGHAVINGVTVSGATVAGMAADGAGASMEVTGSTITSSAKGVVIRNGAVGNSITGNSIHDNTGLGIDLGDDGITANDPSDTDSGPNNLQNFPIIGSALAGSPNTISGTLNSTPGQAFTIHLYANPACDPSGNGEGQTLIGSTPANTNGSGDAVWTLNPVSLTAGDFITATATDSTGNTSEFSACFQARAFSPGTITFSPVSNSETNANHDVNLVVSRTGGSDGAVSVQYSVNDGTALVADHDYSVAAQTGTLTWVNGDASDRLITINVKGDTTFETDETVLLALSNPTGGVSTGGTNPALTITNDDTAPAFSIDDVTHNEGDSGTTAYVFTITKTGSTALNAGVNFQTADGSATVAGNDYQSQTGSLTFLPADTTKTVTVLVNGDTTVEPDETFTVNLSGATNATISDTQGVGTITNDDTGVTLSVSPASVSEDGATNLVYTFTRNPITTGALTVNFSVAGTATFGTDYTQSGAAAFNATSGTVTFAAGSSTATVTIDPTADSTVESDETVILTVTSGTGYNVATPSAATGTITNDDTDVSVAVSPLSVLEDGATNLVYTFTRNGNTTGALTVNFSVAGSATLGTDYTQSGAATFTATNGSVSFAPGSSTATVTIDPTADTTVEPDETVILTVTSGTGYNVAAPSAATGTITNDDTDVSAAVSPLSVLEDGATNLVYTFTRNGVTTGALTANFSVTGTATFGTDYTQSGAAAFNATSGAVTFAAGSTTATVTIDPTTDATVEPDETVILTVTPGTGYNVAAPSAATGTITNDDTDVSVAVSPASVLEDGATNLVYTFTRNGVTTGALTANFTVGGTATFNSDYTQSGAATFTTTSGTVTFAAGSTTATVTIDPTADTTVEPDETVILTVTSGTGYNVATPSAATGTITNDDAGVSVAVSPANVPEDGTANLVYTFTRSGANSDPVTVNFTVGGTATFNSDYTQTGAATFTAASGTVTFAAGSSTATVTIDPTTDVTVEPDETVILTVTSGTGYGVGSPSAATGTIVNDDGTTGGTLQFSAPTYSANESSFFATITVRRLGDTTGAVSVDYATPDDSAATIAVPCETISGIASPRCDFTTAVGTLQWASGDNAPKSFIVLISEDDYVEGPETLTLTLSNPTGGATLGSPSTAILTIDDDANQPTVNPIDAPTDFVRQHYHDFLNREPDQSGFDFWVGNFPPCNGDPQCIEVKRINVSGAFYLSIEFQGTGFFVERLYKSSYGDATGTSTDGGPHQVAVPIVKFSEFLPDTQEIGRGVVVGADGWEAALEAKKVAFTQQFVQRARFLNAYPLSMTPAQFVDTLNANAGNPLSPAERDQLVSDLTGGAKTRAQVLRAVADDQDLINSEFNRGFVLMQYFGFLRRNPNAAPDSDHSGFDFWLKKLNSFNGNFINAEMVKAFLSSTEYRHRAGGN